MGLFVAVSVNEIMKIYIKISSSLNRVRGQNKIGIFPQTYNAIGSIRLSKFIFGGHKSKALQYQRKCEKYPRIFDISIFHIPKFHENKQRIRLTSLAPGGYPEES